MTAQPEIADEELASRSLDGAQDAFADLYERYFDRVYDFLVRMLNNSAEASDVAQDTFMKLLGGMATRPPETSFRAWIFTIARNTAIDRIRRNRRQTNVSSAPLGDEDDLFFYQLPASPVDEPEHSALSDEVSDLVWQAARGLNDNEQALLDLDVRQGLEAQEIAVVLDTSRGNVYTMLSRMRDSLEQSVTALILAKRGRDDCTELNGVLMELGETHDSMSPRGRRAVNRHVSSCDLCETSRGRYTSAAELFGSFAPVLAAAGLKDEILSGVMAEFPAAASSAATVAAAGSAGAGAAQGAATSAALTTAHAGWWSSMGILGKLAVVAAGGLLTTVGAVVGVVIVATVVVGSSDIRIENSGCPTIEMPDLAALAYVADVLPIVGLPDAPIEPGQSGVFTLPSGDFTLLSDGGTLRLQGYGMDIPLTLASNLKSLEIDGEDVLGSSKTLTLRKGSTYNVRVVCE